MLGELLKLGIDISQASVVHFNVTSNPTAEWTARQITEAFSWDTAPRYMIRDQDGVYGDVFRGLVEAMGIEEVLVACSVHGRIPVPIGRSEPYAASASIT